MHLALQWPLLTFSSMYYNTVVLHLFRPFLKVDLTTPSVSPRDICTSCADRIASLLSNYRQLYGLRRVSVLLPHIVLSEGIIHLLNLPNPSAVSNLAKSISGLREMSANHAFAMRCANIIMALARQWNISLPPEVSEAAHDLPQEPGIKSAVARSSPAGDTYLSPMSDPAQQQQHVNAKDVTHELPFAPVKDSPRGVYSAPELFWSPFPDQSLPLQAHHNGGPMDISAMLDAPNEWDQLNRDGFRAAAPNESMLAPLAYNRVSGQWTQT